MQAFSYLLYTVIRSYNTREGAAVNNTSCSISLETFERNILKFL